MINYEVNELPETHALYGVKTYVISHEDDKSLLPSEVEFRLPDGTVCGNIRFQNGPIKEVGVNGCGIEHLLEVVAARLRGYQASDFACDQNEFALSHTLNALAHLKSRTLDRQTRGVEGTNQK